MDRRETHTVGVRIRRDSYRTARGKAAVRERVLRGWEHVDRYEVVAGDDVKAVIREIEKKSGVTANAHARVDVEIFRKPEDQTGRRRVVPDCLRSAAVAREGRARTVAEPHTMTEQLKLEAK